jgi:hypothetical protein
MAETVVTITPGFESLVPDVNSVPIIEGNRLTFLNASDIGATLYTSRDAATVLTPAIGADGVFLEPGARVSFALSAAAAGHYAVLIQVNRLPAPPEAGSTRPPSTVLSIVDAKIGWPMDGSQEAGTKQAGGA